jgi:hypothetical protein
MNNGRYAPVIAGAPAAGAALSTPVPAAATAVRHASSQTFVPDRDYRNDYRTGFTDGRWEAERGCAWDADTESDLLTIGRNPDWSRGYGDGYARGDREGVAFSCQPGS